MYYLAQAGSSVQRVDTDGTVTTLSLPSGVTTPPMITVPTDQGGCVHEADIMRHVVMPGV